MDRLAAEVAGCRVGAVKNIRTARTRASALHSSLGAPFAHFMLALSISAWENRDIQPGNVYEDDEGHPWTEARIQPA